ncbi:hypothetical protein [Azospirillum sp. sgz302134]
MKQIVATAALILAVLPLGGCLVAPATMAVVSAGAELTSLTSTKKTLEDHVVSAATGKDCSTVSFSETGQYCPEKVTVDRSKVYCYRTLADVDCHHIPDPYKNGYTALASPPPDIKPVPKAKGWFDD